MKTLYIISRGIGKRSEEKMLQLERENRIPRASLLEDALSAQLLDERYLQKVPPLYRRLLYRKMPVNLAQIMEALFIQHRYDVILSQSEQVGLPLALLMKYLRMKTPHLLIVSRITSVDERKSRQKIWFFKRVKDVIDRFLIWSSVQRRFAIDQLGASEERIKLIKRGTDQKFWSAEHVDHRPAHETDTICAVGMEARDYPTLVEALRPLDIPCHIATGAARGEIFDTVKRLYDIKDLPDNLTTGFKSSEELRELYARCRFVVVPLMETDSDNGLTAILEAMSMGKTVICSRVEGQVDVIEDGVTGIYVPQGDPHAMREAIVDLWSQPEKCRRMGEAARQHIEKHHTMEKFVEAIHHEVTTVLDEDLSRSRSDLQLEGAEA